MPFLARVLTTLALWSLMTATGMHAAEVSPKITVGTQEVGLTVGYLLPHRLTTGPHDQAARPGLHALLDDDDD